MSDFRRNSSQSVSQYFYQTLVSMKDIFLIGYIAMLNPRKFLASRLTATGLPRGTASLFEKLRDETCLREYLLSSPFSPLVIRSSSLSVAFRLSFSLIFILSSFIALENGVHPFLRSLLRPLFHMQHRLSLLRAHATLFDHLPRRWKVCWFVRWPVVSTPLHMVTYHQSTPTTRFALPDPMDIHGS